MKSIDFYTMTVTTGQGKTQSYRGAVVFSEDNLSKKSGLAAISAIVLPHPTTDDLHETLKRVHHAPGRSVLLIKDFAREDVVGLLQTMCNDGAPLDELLKPSSIELHGVTDFQKLVYQITRSIPHGETRPYTWLAMKMRKLRCERAVGRALGTNPFPLFVPCHRVIKKDGTLGGFMGDERGDSWQVRLKKALLDSEEKHRQPSLFA